MAFIEPNDSVLNEQFSAADGQSENTGNTLRDENPASSSEQLNTDKHLPENPDDTEEKTSQYAPETLPSTSSAEDAGTQSGDLQHEVKEREEFEPTLATDVPPEESGGVDYFKMDKQELIQALQLLLTNKPLQQIGDDADIIKINFYKKHKAEVEKKRKLFIEGGGNLEEFKPGEDQLESQFKELFKHYRDIKSDHNRRIEDEKQHNLKQKYAIIEEIKDLLNRKESLNETFQEFRDLQKKWRNIGPVPQSNVKDLWETYNHHIEKFYDFIKINKELRDLDLKKNLELKISLCEKAEELILETDIVKAFNQLQKFHEDWRDIGPVPNEMRDETWNRFKEATSKINKNYQDHFEILKEEQKKNLDHKSALCEKVEDIISLKIESAKAWEDKSNEILDIQKVWKTIGFAPKKDNNRIYQRFRAACDEFFNRKREFFTEFKEEQLNNLQLKTELCLQAEALKESNEWKKTTEDLINIQKRWKEIGPVPRKYSDQLWKRFRAACDEFFLHRSKHFENVDSQYEDNLQKKLSIISEIENYVSADSVDINFRALKEFQRRWSEIGFVPMKNKEEIQKKFRDAINKHYDNLKIDDDHKNLLKFTNKLDNISNKPKGFQKLRIEREKTITKLKQFESDITLWENNIGFFAKNKKSEAMREEVQKRIDETKNKITLLEARIKLIDSELDEMHQ
jgi:Domain of Unknown Function (DUF349)